MASDGMEQTKKPPASERVRAALAAALEGLGIALEARDIQIERPDDPGHGDLSSNVALVTAKRLKRNPRELAAEIARRVSLDADFIERVEVAGAGKSSASGTLTGTVTSAGGGSSRSSSSQRIRRGPSSSSRRARRRSAPPS
jgi:hypothetical protein